MKKNIFLKNYRKATLDDAEDIMYLINVKYCKGNSNWRTGFDKCQGFDSIEAVNEIIPMTYIIRHGETKDGPV